MTTTPESTISFDTFERWVRSYVDDTLRAETLSRYTGDYYYHEYGQRSATAARTASLLADLFGYGDEMSTHDTLDRLVAAVKDWRFEDGNDAGAYRFRRIVDETRLIITIGHSSVVGTLSWIDAFEVAMDEFGVFTTDETKWAIKEAEWAEQDRKRALEDAARSGNVTV